MHAPSPLFETADGCARDIVPAEVPLLQALFEDNAEYFRTVNGRAPLPGEAQVEFEELPPPHLGFSDRWVIGLFDREGRLAVLAIVLSDLMAKGVWHLALVMAASRLHGTGVAGRTYAALEAWATGGGARWMRLAVVVGNRRAERFWARRGYRVLRSRLGVDTGGRVNDVQVLMKPLAGGSVDEYLALVPRDHPSSTLP